MLTVVLFEFKNVFIHNFDGNLDRNIGIYYEYLYNDLCQSGVQQKLNSQLDTYACLHFYQVLPKVSHLENKRIMVEGFPQYLKLQINTSMKECWIFTLKF